MPAGPASAAADAAAARAASVRLRVRTADGSARTIDVAAADEAEAVRRALRRGHAVLGVERGAAARGSITTGRTDFSLLLFSQELLALLDAGLNLTESLRTLRAKERKAGAKALLARIVDDVSQGASFSDVLARWPQQFPPVYVATVRASERTGDLAPALARFITYQLQIDGLRRKLVAAAIYPAMLLGVGALVTLFLLGYVVPRFAAVYESAGRALPWMSQMLLALGRAIGDHALAALAALIGSTALAAAMLLRHGGRAFVVDRLLALPWLARRSEEFRLARFYRAVSLLLASGIAVPRAMAMVDGLVGAAQRARLARAREHVEHGRSLSAALLDEGLASPVAQSLLAVGERSGQLADMLERTARFHDDEFARWVDFASRLLEPVLMLVIGLVIGAVVVLMYMPIFELAGSLQ